MLNSIKKNNRKTNIYFFRLIRNMDLETHLEIIDNTFETIRQKN